MSNIKDIVDVSIVVKEPTSNPVSYSGMLILADKPATIPTARDVFEIFDVNELVNTYGYENTDPLYLAANVAFSQSPCPTSIFVKEIEYTEEQSGGETIVTMEIEDTLNAAMSNTQWYGFVFAIAADLTNIQLEAAAEWAETNKRMFGFGWGSGTIPADITDFDHTWAIYYGNVSETATLNPYMHVALMAKCFGYDNGSETWAFKTLKRMKPSALSNADVTAIREGGGNFYQTYANKDITLDGKTGSGEWIDIIRFLDWLEGRLQQRAVEFFAANPKVPFTDAGINGVQNFVSSVLTEGQAYGGIAPTQFDENGEEVPGFTVSVPLARSVSEADRAARYLRNVKFTANLAGAIHKVKIVGELVY